MSTATVDPSFVSETQPESFVLPTLMGLNILPFFHPAMRQKPPQFNFDTHGSIAERLAVLLHEKSKQLGVAGLSANQVQLPFRVFVVGNTESHVAFFNPVIRTVSRETVLMEEGCITMPNFFLALQRPERINITFQDVTGAVQEKSYDGVMARVILHEYDHMEGTNFTAHASNFKLRWELDKYKKSLKKNNRRKVTTKETV